MSVSAMIALGSAMALPAFSEWQDCVMRSAVAFAEIEQSAPAVAAAASRACPAERDRAIEEAYNEMISLDRVRRPLARVDAIQMIDDQRAIIERQILGLVLDARARDAFGDYSRQPSPEGQWPQ